MADLDARLLRGFVAVAEELNFTRAAERLHLAQQALSAQIRQLEERLGAKLFERSTRQVALTPAGRALLPHARAALEATGAGEAAVRDAVRAVASTLRVGLSTTAVSPVTTESIRRFTERRPDITLSLRNSPFREATGGLAEALVDVAFVRPPFRSQGLSMMTVVSEPRVAALPADHPLAARDEVRPADLVDEPWVWVDGTDPDAADYWTLAEHRGGRPLRIGAEITSFDEYFGVVGAGLAIGTSPLSAALAVGPGFPRVRFVPVADLPPTTIAIAWRTDGDSPLVAEFVRTALEVGGEAG